MNGPRAAFASASLGAGGLVSGGLFAAASRGFFDVTGELYNPATNAWVPVAAAPLGKGFAAAATLSDGDVLVTGGSQNAQSGLADVALFTPPATPGAPVAAAATPHDGTATVVFAPPASDGGLPITQYNVTASTGQTAVTAGARTVATVTGLTNGTPVTFTVTATNALGAGAASAATTAVTPTSASLAAPQLTLTGLRTKLKLAAFLKGVAFTVTPDQVVSLRVSLLGSIGRATIARDFPLVLATKGYGLSAATRPVTIAPAKRLVGKPRKATVQLVIEATSTSGRRTTATKLLTITR